MSNLLASARACLLPTMLISLLFGAGIASAEPKISDDVVKIGILNDQSGLYADLAGPGSVEAARVAIEEFGGKVLGKKIELVYADHQNKADIGLAKAREWFDRDGVDMIADFSNSSVGFAVQSLAKERDRVALITAVPSDMHSRTTSARP
jgi:branched-chain amino acid transport system substrate-binding protein